MYDSSFPTPFPLPWPELSHSLGSRNTECKHFSSYSEGVGVGGCNGFWSLQKLLCRQMSSIFTLLGDEISKSRNGKHYVFARSAVFL